MRVLRRRDQTAIDAEVLRPGGETAAPMLFIDGTPFPPDETAGYLLLEVSEVELAELKRGGYAVPRTSSEGA